MSKVTLESIAAEFRSGNSIPVERATFTRERMQEVLEAYADARVREALEAALATVEELEDSYRDESLYVVQHCANNIRALLPD